MKATVENYKQEDWVALYQSALIELEQAKMSGRIEAARVAILARMGKLCTMPGLHPEERQAIEDALRGLSLLRAEEARFDANRRSICRLARIVGGIREQLESEDKHCRIHNRLSKRAEIISR
jgi:hypothetical protein